MQDTVLVHAALPDTTLDNAGKQWPETHMEAALLAEGQMEPTSAAKGPTGYLTMESTGQTCRRILRMQ